MPRRLSSFPLSNCRSDRRLPDHSRGNLDPPAIFEVSAAVAAPVAGLCSQGAGDNSSRSLATAAVVAVGVGDGEEAAPDGGACSQPAEGKASHSLAAAAAADGDGGEASSPSEIW